MHNKATMGMCDRIHWIGHTTKSIRRTCRAAAADADAIGGGLGASFRVAVARMPWNRDAPRVTGVSV